jgi:eukaryotic-like serine/threonine-protein kinase
MSLITPDPKAWGTIEPYLNDALDLQPVERERWLADLAMAHPDIATAVKEFLQQRAALETLGFLDVPLLAADNDLGVAVCNALDEPAATDGGSPIASHPVGAAAQALEQFERERLGRPQSLQLTSDQTIGPYRLIREIGHGGMSTVWLARRCDEQLKRDIALKLPLMGHRVHAERFQRECDILSALTHPNIARLYDAGVTTSGQPYLAMEYVEGSSITETCDRRRATLRQRLQLFRQVLDVVQFAHTHLIIHRDLKPSNILLTPEGRVVLVDFGIGKLLGETSPQGQLTEIFGNPLTLDYAAPEQISKQTLSTASDIYSLGVILHEMLVGAHPYRVKRNSHAALEEAILGGQLRSPSQSEICEQHAVARQSSVRALSRALTGDLDTIVLKAMRRDPADRYPSASAFAQDIDNHLQQLPINARPDSFNYRFARFVLRHRVPVTAATLIVVAMAGGTGVALWQAAKAAAERDRATALAARSDATTDFLGTLITDAAASEQPVSVSEMLMRSEKLVLGDPGGTDESRATVLSMIASYQLNLGNARRADELLRRARSLLEKSDDVDLRARIACTHALAISFLRQQAEAIEALDRQIAN